MGTNSFLGSLRSALARSQPRSVRPRYRARRRASRRLCLETLEDRCLLSATLVRDINPATLDSAHGSPPQSFLINVNGTLFFTAFSPETGVELWKSDGTAKGTTLVKDLNPGPGDSSLAYLTTVNSTLFFAMDDGVRGWELWKSDGTATGTVLVKDINPGSAGSFPANLTNMNGTLFFAADDGTRGFELWKSDGTATGTVLVKDIRPGGLGSRPAGLTSVSGAFFFVADDGVHGQELWRSDGTAKGTALVRDITSDGNSGFNSLTNVNGTLFFSAGRVTGSPPFSFIADAELWKSDGTEAGTVRVKDIFPGSGGSNPGGLTNVNGTLFFAASDPASGRELWKSDGTAKGTVLVKDIHPGGSNSVLGELTNVNGMLFFRAEDGVRGFELWKSDGTAKGTVLVKDILPGDQHSHSTPSQLTNVNGTLLFTAVDGVHGRELWRSDGTSKGTALIRDIFPGTADSNSLQLTAVGGALFFRARHPATGFELWRSDGTAKGTDLVKDINTASAGSSPVGLTEVGGVLFFKAFTPETGYELWKSNGTAKGTVLVRDIHPGGSSAPQNLTNVGGMLFFTVDTDNLWRSDGTPEGTVLVKDIWPGDSSDIRDLTVVNGTLFFSAEDAEHGRELWRSDGTPEGTVVIDIEKGGFEAGPGSWPQDLTNVNGTLFFTARGGDLGRELWKSDGTPEGTVLVKDIFPGADSIGSIDAPAPENLTNVNGTLFFTADDGVRGRELWKSDGTAAGTVLVMDIRAGADGSFATPSSLQFTPMNGTVFFAADDGVHGRELWQSDGTAAGTFRVRDINPGAAGSDPGNLANINGMLFFAATDGAGGVELWRSNGTDAGTTLVRDIDPGSGSSNPASLTALGGTIFFTADDGVRGRELWQSDGTQEGTFLVQDIFPGSTGSNPQSLTAVGGRLFFAADDGVHGRELWALPAVGGPPLNQPPVLDPIADQTVGEGSTLSFTVTATDPNPGDTLTFSLVSGPAGASIESVTGAFTWTPADGPATVTVTVRVTDSGDPALSDTRTFTVTVLNVAPSAGISGPTSGTPGQALAFTLSATDPSALDQAAGFTYVIDWGDGSPLQTIDAFPGSGSGVTVSHTYATAGAYVVRVSAIDRDGGIGTVLLAEPVMITAAPGASDLSWSGGGILAPPAVAAGESFTIGRTFAVGGEPVGPFTIAYWASLDDIFGNEDDFLVGVELFEGAAPGIHSGVSPAFTIGAAGTYYLFGVLDSLGEVAETNEDNNLVLALATLLITDPEDDE